MFGTFHWNDVFQHMVFGRHCITRPNKDRTLHFVEQITQMLQLFLIFKGPWHTCSHLQGDPLHSVRMVPASFFYGFTPDDFIHQKSRILTI